MFKLKPASSMFVCQPHEDNVLVSGNVKMGVTAVFYCEAIKISDL